MDPYQSPTSSDDVSLTSRGRPCPACGSANTCPDDPLRPRPGILSVILFGWVAILCRTAFSYRMQTCRDCGTPLRYRSIGNHLALAFLLLIVSLILVASFD